MPHSTLSAVPAQASKRPHPREAAFQKVVTDALETLDGTQATDTIMKLYRGDLGALTAQADAALAEATSSATQSRMYYDMLQNVQLAASHGIWERAAQAAELSTYKNIVGTLLHLADRADEDTVDATAVRAALAMTPAEAVRMPVVTALYPARDFRAGQFTAAGGDVTLIWPFTGWALVDHGPGALGSIEPVFIVQDRVIPRSVVELERRVRFERFLPHVYAPPAPAVPAT